MRVASLDLGSNTFLLLIADVEVNQKVKKITRVLCDEIEVTRLSQGVNQSKMLHPEAMARAKSCFEKYAAIIKEHKVDRIMAVATSAARDAKNGQEFMDLARKFGIEVEIIAGDREAQLTYLGASFDLPQLEKPVVIDVGGGSTEIIGLESGDRLKGYSLNVGSVRLSEMFISKHPVAAKELEALNHFILEKIAEKKEMFSHLVGRPVIAVAGTPTTLAAVEQQIDFAEEKIHKYSLSTEKVLAWTQKLSHMNLVERLQVKGMAKGREDVIVAGGSILYQAAKHLGAKSLNVSTKGVRYGLALSTEAK